MSRRTLHRKPPPPLDGFSELDASNLSDNPSPETPSHPQSSPSFNKYVPTMETKTGSRLSGRVSLPTAAAGILPSSRMNNGSFNSAYDGHITSPLPEYVSQLESHEDYTPDVFQQNYYQTTEGIQHSEHTHDYLPYDASQSLVSPIFTDDYLNSAFDNMLISMDSPRPKGPQDLPQDCLLLPNDSLKGRGSRPHGASLPTSADSHVSPFDPGSQDHRLSSHKPDTAPKNEFKVPFSSTTSSLRQNSGARKFQNLSLGGNSLTAEDSDSSLEFTNYDDYGTYDYSPATDSAHETTRTNSRWNNPSNSSKGSELPYPIQDPETLESQDGSGWTTPTRIPTLAARDSMKKISNPTSPFANATPPNLQFINTSNHEYLPYSSSPESPLNSRSLSSSPTKKFVNRSSRNDYASHVSESRSSRSPSPKKYMGSPVSKSPTKITSSFYPVDEDYSNVFDTYEETRMPRWSLIEHDGFDYYDDSFIQPPEEEQFDYSILPELPSRTDDHGTKQIPIPDNYKETDHYLQPSTSVRRKNDDLPPVPLDLPSLPFSSALLSNSHFSTCANVWSLKSIFDWCVKLTDWMHSVTLSRKELKKVLIKLMAYFKPDIPVDLINRNACHVIDAFVTAALLKTSELNADELCIDVSGSIQGVLVDLTDCYSFDQSHKNQTELSQKCYSSSCPINKLIEHENLMKSTDISELELGNDWASHWKLTAQDMTIDISESKRQSFLFDLIKFEQTFIQRAECFIDVVGPDFIRQAKVISSGQKAAAMKDFEQNILSSSADLCSIHQKSLYSPLLRILVSDGKFIKRITDVAKLYTSWSKEAKKPLLAYMSSMPMIQDLLNSPELKSWDQTLRLNPKVKELQVNGNLLLMSTFNSRYQQLPLQLMDIRKFFDEGDEEFSALTEAIESIRGLGTRVNEMKVYADNIHSLQVVQGQLTWKSNVYQPNLHLNSKNRKLFFRGDLLRKGELKINTSHVHMIALDNFILLTDKQRNQKSFSMKVSETPIPADYLIVENRDKESSGLGLKSNNTQSTFTGEESAEEVSSYPFKIRYAGRGKTESHTMIAATEKDRQKWISVLQQTKSNITKRNSPAAPYSFRLIDNSFFAYEPAMKLTKFPILPSNDPVSILAREPALAQAGTSTFINRQVQCSEMFNFMNGQFHFLGTSAGVYCFDEKNIWKKIINMNNVTRITVIPDSNVALVLANKMLRYYPLKQLIDLYYGKNEHVSSYQISNESIMFYEFGQHLGLPTLIVAKRKNAGSTTFKVFVLQEDNNGILSTIEVVKKFYIQAECYGVSIFNTSLAVHTQRGFEILDLQKLSPRTVPEFPNSDSTSKKLDSYSRKKIAQTPEFIRKMISHATPLGMFKLTNNKEFLLVFSECAIFVNRAGKLSRTSMVRFDYRARDIAFADNQLFLVCEEVIEIWTISDSATASNKLTQVIPNKDIHLLNSQTLTFRVVNPLKTDVQLIFRLLKKKMSHERRIPNA